MIILSGVLVVLAIALLVTGIVTGNTGHEVVGLDGLKLIYVSIGVSIISALCLAIGVFLRRKELFGGAESTASTKRSAASRSAKAARTAKTKARVGAGDDAPVTMTSTAATEVPAETSVFVVPGRKRYHLETCRQLAGRDKEELTFVEAREEGFTACTACLPDTALAARAAFTESEASAAASPTESIDKVADTTDLTAAADDDPALVTRTDLPVTKLDTDTERDKDTDLDTREIEPAAESPAAAELTEAPESDVATESEATADTTRFDEVPESEAASEQATERPLARSRSLFEPLDPPDTETTDDATAEDAEPAAAADTEPATAVDEPADEDLFDRPAPAEAESDDEDTTTDRHVDAEPEDTEPPAEVSDVTETSVTEDEATDEPVDDVDHHADTSEPAAAATEVADEPAADEPQDDEDHDAAAGGASEFPDLPYVRILSGTKRYHRPDCALIEDIAEDADDLETLSPAEAKERGCTPCLVCQPDKDPADRY